MYIDRTRKATFDGPTPSGYNLACSRIAISCRTCERYLNIVSKTEQVWLRNARSESLGVLTIARGFEGLVEGKRDVARDGKVVERGVNQGLSSKHISLRT